MITIELPWPNYKILSPNASVHWTVKAKAVKAERERASWSVLIEHGKWMRDVENDDNLRCTFVYHQPDNYHRDLKNVDTAMKGAIDGVCDALGIDDSQIKETVSRFGDVDRPDGRVVMTLEAM